MHKDGIEALECLQRAFEVAINYCVYSNGAGSKLLKLRYDTELLVTGVKSKNPFQTDTLKKSQNLSQKVNTSKKFNRTKWLQRKINAEYHYSGNLSGFVLLFLQ